MSRDPKVLVFGIDGATFDLAQPWVDVGLLPTLRQLMAEGVRAPLRSTVPALALPAWTTAATGCNPGKHNVFSFRAPTFAPGGSRPVSSRDVRRPRVWEIAAQLGKRSIVLQAPLTDPPRGDVGTVLSGVFTPPGVDEFVAPTRRGRELASAVPGYRPDVDTRLLRRGRLASFRDEALAVQNLHVDAAAVLLAREPWDLAWVNFHVLDIVQHFFWRYMDAEHPAWPGPGPLQHVIRDFYVTLDAALARLLAIVPDTTTVLLASAHGVAPLHRYWSTSRWLVDEGLLTLRPERGLRRLGNLMRPSARRLQSGVAVADRIDWTATKAHCVGGAGNGVSVNLRGREPYGIVEPGAEHDALLSELRRRLLAWRDPQSGMAVVTAVHRREEIYHGPHRDNAPDLVIETDPTVCPVDGLARQVSVAAGIEPDERTGHHAREGMLVLRGPDVRTGLELCSVPIDDLAPTVLYLLGVPIDSEMDGRVLTDALDADRLDAQPIATREHPYQTVDTDLAADVKVGSLHERPETLASP